MNDIIITANRAGAPLAVDASPTPLRLPKGSAIFAYQGDLWITQEGVRDDWILRDVSTLGPPLVEMPFGGPSPPW